MTLPTPPTLEQRLDAAAEAYRDLHLICPPDNPSWQALSEGSKNLYRLSALEVCRAFAPEHFKDPHNETGDAA